MAKKAKRRVVKTAESIKIGKLFKAARSLATGLTAKDFAEKLTDWSYYTYRKWEAGQRTPSLESIQGVANALGAELQIRFKLPDGNVLDWSTVAGGDGE